MIITHTININIQLYQSIHLTHLQAISRKVKSHNHSTEFFFFFKIICSSPYCLSQGIDRLNVDVGMGDRWRGERYCTLRRLSVISCNNIVCHMSPTVTIMPKAMDKKNPTSGYSLHTFFFSVARAKYFSCFTSVVHLLCIYEYFFRSLPMVV